MHERDSYWLRLDEKDVEFRWCGHDELKGRCPWCVPTPRTEALYVWPESGAYRCFGCSRQGTLSQSEYAGFTKLSFLMIARSERLSALAQYVQVMGQLMAHGYAVAEGRGVDEGTARRVGS